RARPARTRTAVTPPPARLRTPRPPARPGAATVWWATTSSTPRARPDARSLGPPAGKPTSSAPGSWPERLVQPAEAGVEQELAIDQRQPGKQADADHLRRETKRRSWSPQMQSPRQT